MGELGFLGAPIPERYGGAGHGLRQLRAPVRGAGAGGHGVPGGHERPRRAQLADAPAMGQRGPEAALPGAPGARREAGHLRAHRAGRGHGRRRPSDDGPPRWRRLRPQRRQDLDQPGRHRRPLPGLRDGRSSEAPQGHHGLHRRARHGRLLDRHAQGQAGHQRRQHRPALLRRCARAGRATASARRAKASPSP